MKSTEIHLIERPVGMPEDRHFRAVSVDVPAPAEGEVQVRDLYMAVDPAMRGRMLDARSYVPPFALDAPMEGPALGEVLDSRHPDFRSGDPRLFTENPQFQTIAHPSGLSYPAAGPAATLAGEERGAIAPAPRLGAHTDEVLMTILGMDDGEIAKLRDRRIVA